MPCSRVCPSGFWMSTGEPVGQRLERLEVLLGHQGDVVHRVVRRRGDGLRDRAEHVRDAVLVGERLRPRDGAVGEPPTG